MRNTFRRFDAKNRALMFCIGLFLTSGIGCGGNPDQRKSGTLATPIDFVEQAGEAQGKAEDASKTTAKKK